MPPRSPSDFSSMHVPQHFTGIWALGKLGRPGKSLIILELPIGYTATGVSGALRKKRQNGTSNRSDLETLSSETFTNSYFPPSTSTTFSFLCTPSSSSSSQLLFVPSHHLSLFPPIFLSDSRLFVAPHSRGLCRRFPRSICGIRHGSLGPSQQRAVTCPVGELGGGIKKLGRGLGGGGVDRGHSWGHSTPLTPPTLNINPFYQREL